MTDTIAILVLPVGVQINFQIDNAWWPLANGHIKTWPSADKARAFLRQAAETYKRCYGEPLGWDVDSIPVLGGGNR